MQGANMKQSGSVNHNFKVRTMKEELGIDKINISSFMKYKKKKDGEVNEIEKLKRNLAIAGVVAIIVMLVEFYLLIIK